MDSSLILSIAALALAVVSLSLLWVWRNAPPNARLWNDLRGRVEDVEHDLEQLHGRLHKRARQDNMDKARDAAKGGSIVDEAKAILSGAPAGGAGAPSPLAPPAGGGDVQAYKAQLRRMVRH